MRTLRISGLVFLYLLAPFVVHAQIGHITAAEAKNHIGEKATVCGSVVSTHYAARSKGNPTFLNLDEPYPKQIFTIVIWGSDRDKFGDPETKYRDKQVCVTGKIVSYRGAAEIAANEPSQIEIRK
jgi:micrococcal nuclease